MARPARAVTALLGATFATSAFIAFPGVAHAYDKEAAKDYANTYALTPNSYYAKFGNDCTNFISQVMYAGGIRHRNSGSAANKWYYKKSPGGSILYTNSWTVAHDNYRLMSGIADRSGSYGRGTQYRMTPAWHLAGDPVYYDWDSDGDIDHDSVNVAIGDDSETPGWNGNLINQHTKDRKRAIWHLRPYNSRYASTSFRFLHFDRDTR